MPFPTYRERLRPSPLWWCAGLGVGVLLGLVAWPIDRSLGAGVGVVGAVVACAALWWSAPLVAVTETPEGPALRAGRAQIPVAFLGEIRTLDRAGMRRELGPALNARAYVCLRSWARTGIRVQLVDPADPTPYWVVSTRAPAALAAALVRSRSRVPDAP